MSFSPSFSFKAWCKLNELIEVRFKLKIDIEDKREAEDIDSEQMALNKDCSSITYKVDPLRVPRNACTYNGWLENCKELKLLTEKELKESYAVRESLFVAREKTKNLLYAQQEKTEHTIRRRIFETQRQRNELQWQKMKVRDSHKAINGMKEFCHLMSSKCFIKYLIITFFCAFLSLNNDQTQDELDKVSREISDLHETLRVKDNALKLAETRLENRTNRF